MGEGDHVFGERLRVTTGNAASYDDEFPNVDFFLDVNDLFDNRTSTWETTPMLLLPPLLLPMLKLHHIWLSSLSVRPC
jgi:hypothetical protein